MALSAVAMAQVRHHAGMGFVHRSHARISTAMKTRTCPPCPPVPGANGRNTAEMMWPASDGGGWLEPSWRDVVTVVEWDMHHQPQLMARVNRSHIWLTSWTRMRCHLVSQLFRGLEEFGYWVEKEGWKRDAAQAPEPQQPQHQPVAPQPAAAATTSNRSSNAEPPADIKAAALRLRGFVR